MNITRFNSLVVWFALLLAMSTLNSRFSDAAGPSDGQMKQYYEIRTYLVKDEAGADAIDDYLENALLPGLARLQIGPVGVFSPAQQDTNASSDIVVVIPYENAEAALRTGLKLMNDEQYLSDAKAYLNTGTKEPPFTRIRSELLVAMDCMPQLNVPKGTLENGDRVYELRLYESANERLGHLKVDMFNNGEVPIFYDSGIVPVFIGQSLIGPQTPNLTYLTVYPNDNARLEAWQNFRGHPDWQVLKTVEKYQGTVSHIDKYILKAKAYSKM